MLISTGLIVVPPPALDAGLELPTKRSQRPVRFNFDASYQDYTAERYFGLGNDSDDEMLTYSGTQKMFNGAVTVILHDRLEFTGRYGRLEAETDPGESGR